jgi:uncharacterized membrane protein YciS (DUF1049 family)
MINSGLGIAMLILGVVIGILLSRYVYFRKEIRSYRLLEDIGRKTIELESEDKLSQAVGK